MKSIEELYKEIKASDELKNELLKASKDGKVEEFFKAHGCDPTIDDIKAFAEANMEMSSEEINKLAGGKAPETIADVLESIVVFGIR